MARSDGRTEIIYDFRSARARGVCKYVGKHCYSGTCLRFVIRTRNFNMTKFTFTEKKDTRSGFGVGLHELGKSNSNVVALCADLTGSLKMDAFKKDFPASFKRAAL